MPDYVDGVTQSIQPVLSAMGLWFLSEQSASTSATIDFTSGISSTYEEYELHIINALLETDGLHLRSYKKDAASGRMLVEIVATGDTSP